MQNSVYPLQGCVFVGSGEENVVDNDVADMVLFLAIVAFGASVVAPLLPTSRVTDPEVVVYALVTFPEFDAVAKLIAGALVVGTVIVVVMEGYVSEPVSPSRVKGSTESERVTMVAVFVPEVQIDESAQASAAKIVAAHSERIFEAGL